MNLVTVAPMTPAALRPWVSQLWVACTDADGAASREHVLPSGQMHLVVRVAGPPLRLLGDDGTAAASSFDGPVVGGVRDRYYAKEHAGRVVSVGAMLRPGASQALFGVSAAELAGQHTALADLCGAEATSLHAQLADSRDPQRQLALLCQWLTRQVSGAGPAPDMVLAALDAMARPARIDALVRASRYSHRGFIARFRQATGLGPKRYARLMRFRQLLGDLRRHPGVALADLALRHGYSDQAHMAREFRAVAGTTPTQYRTNAPAQANHLVLPATR